MDGSADFTKSFFSLASSRLPVFFKERITVPVTARNIHMLKNIQMNFILNLLLSDRIRIILPDPDRDRHSGHA